LAHFCFATVSSKLNLFPDATGADEDWQQKQAVEIMAMKLGSSVVVCVLASASWSVQATPTTVLDFSSLLPNSTLNAVVPATYQGFAFTSSDTSKPVTAYKGSGAGSALATPPSPTLNAVFSNSSFTINVISQLFDKVSFNGGTNSGSIVATAYDGAGTALGSGGPGGFGAGSYWDTAATSLGSYATHIQSVSFTATQFFSIANITFSLSTDTGSGGGGGSSGTVPEPASFGLVALALFAAGAVARRRKSA
jgi:hypothetical protein